MSLTLGLDACRWFLDFLKDRSQAVRVDGIQSEPLELVKGVPQGSILGPLMFTLYINNIGDEIRKCQIHLNADDTAIYSSTADQALSLYFIQLKFVLNAKKTNFMILIGSKSWLKINLHLRAWMVLELIRSLHINT